MRFVRRLLVVCLVAAGIVAAGWGLKQVDAINATFQKGAPPDGQEGGHAGQTPKSGENRSGDDAALPDDTATAEQQTSSSDTAATDNTTRTGEQTGGAGVAPAGAPAKDESRVTPGDDAEQPPKGGESRGASSGSGATNESSPESAGSEQPGSAARPEDADKADDTAHERWPALDFTDASHALRFMIPVVAVVVAVDLVRRRRRKPIARTAQPNAP